MVSGNTVCTNAGGGMYVSPLWKWAERHKNTELICIHSKQYENNQSIKCVSEWELKVGLISNGNVFENPSSLIRVMLAFSMDFIKVLKQIPMGTGRWQQWSVIPSTSQMDHLMNQLGQPASFCCVHKGTCYLKKKKKNIVENVCTIQDHNKAGLS